MRRPRFIAEQARHAKGLLGRLVAFIMARETFAENMHAIGTNYEGMGLPDGSTPKGYVLTDFEDAFARYLVSESATAPQSAKTKENIVFQSAARLDAVAVHNCQKAKDYRACGGVADQKEGNVAVANDDVESWSQIFG